MPSVNIRPGSAGGALALSALALVVALIALVVSILALTQPQPLQRVDASSGPAEYAKVFIDRALGYYDANGRQATIDYYNSLDSVNGQWYVFIIDENDVMIAHPLRKDRIGTTKADRVDSTGYDYGTEMAATTEEGQRVSYNFKNPATGIDGLKHTWLKRHAGLLFGSGWWESG